jgi:hypothetical protein
MCVTFSSKAIFLLFFFLPLSLWSKLWAELLYTLRNTVCYFGDFSLQRVLFWLSCVLSGNFATLSGSQSRRTASSWLGPARTTNTYVLETWFKSQILALSLHSHINWDKCLNLCAFIFLICKIVLIKPESHDHPSIVLAWFLLRVVNTC